MSDAKEIIVPRISEPGFYHDISHADYHADALCELPSLSRSLADVLISKAPIHARIAHPRLSAALRAPGDTSAPEEDATPEMDFGSLGHRLLLGRGQDIVVGDFNDFRTKDARAWRDEVRAVGQLPVLKKNNDRAVMLKTMAEIHMKNLGILDQFQEAKSEVVAVWKDGKSWLRCMYDKLLLTDSKATIFDIKITGSANPSACAKQIANMNYDLQYAFYKCGVERLRPRVAGRVEFIFVFIENSFPFCVTPITLDGLFRTCGESKFASAYFAWEHCMATDNWPPYVSGVTEVEAPKWALPAEIGRKTIGAQ